MVALVAELMAVTKRAAQVVPTEEMAVLLLTLPVLGKGLQPENSVPLQALYILVAVVVPVRPVELEVPVVVAKVLTKITMLLKAAGTVVQILAVAVAVILTTQQSPVTAVLASSLSVTSDKELKTMNYALIEESRVVNLIWLNPGNAHEFPGAVPCDGVPVQIGDTYDGETFYRDGDRVRTNAEIAYKALDEARIAYMEGVQEA